MYKILNLYQLHNGLQTIFEGSPNIYNIAEVQEFQQQGTIPITPKSFKIGSSCARDHLITMQNNRQIALDRNATSQSESGNSDSTIHPNEEYKSDATLNVDTAEDCSSSATLVKEISNILSSPSRESIDCNIEYNLNHQMLSSKIRFFKLSPNKQCIFLNNMQRKVGLYQTPFLQMDENCYLFQDHASFNKYF